ncbi:AMP-binding protein [Sphingomonas sp. So64.6b]|uniref:AMP-binding protein n=1 Tax=Sphingomonas sp. So64.6b TaxID=2997354 RepID=UPI0015FFBF59|nr:AMP-binding protein [Sphingomonas sp. So64.6b]QNA86323.1 AMP-binding protein [Sphingomonas sp. So64.6b]
MAATPKGETLAPWQSLSAQGMLFSYWADRFGDHPAIHSIRGGRSFAELDGNANRLLAALRGAGLGEGSPVAALCGNIPEFVEVMLACQRGGLRFTPINWHLAAEEIAYILHDCEAEAWIVQADFADKVATDGAAGVDPRRTCLRLAVEGQIDGFADYAEALATQSGTAPADAVPGRTMLYTSGTTGRPKGVVKAASAALMPMRFPPFDYRDGDVNLLCGPAYHGGPLAFDLLFPLSSGAGIVMMEKFDARDALALIERHRVTHTHMVATMFQRLLALPFEERTARDLSSLRMVVHGAAPTPPDVKRAMIDWLGPVLWEYYAATEVATKINITSEEWLRKPGSVGKIPDDSGICILDDKGRSCLPGVSGRICFPDTATRYHNAPDKNRDVFGGAHFTVGDIGFIDQEGYLFLTGRSAETIISGGVNIYPQEIDNALLGHPAVAQSCTVGVPNREWGEEVRGVVMLASGYDATPALEVDLLDLLRGTLAHYKVPRRIDFVAAIPQSEAGKVLRGQVRSSYWAGRARSI